MEIQEFKSATIRDESLGSYFIEVDEHQYTLKENIIRVNKDTKKESDGERIIGHYTSLLACIKKVIRLRISDKDKTYTLVQFMNALENEREKLGKLYTTQYMTAINFIKE